MNFMENESPTKLRGGYYTDARLARFLTKWVFAIKPRRVLEPSCGDGIFFEVMGKVPNEQLEYVLGFEIKPSEAAKAKERGRTFLKIEPDIRTRDFLYWALIRFPSGEKFDGVLGNPPYIRYQYLDENLQNIAEAIFRYHSLPFTRHTNAWVPFVVASVSLLSPGGRLGMVLPSELLHVLHAQSLRNFLAEECERILIIDPNELWFENALQGAIILLAQKKKSRNSACKGLGIVQTKSNSFLDSDPAGIFDGVEYLNGETIEGKWLQALLSKKERELLSSIKHRKDVFRFDSLAEVDVGIVTGANNFFLVSDEVVEKFGLQNWAHPMFGRSEHVEGVIYSKASHAANRQNGLPTNFIWFGDEPIDKFPKTVRVYIESGEREGLHTRYKCRVRKPWYSVPSVYFAPVGMLKRAHEFPRLILNRAKAFTTDTAYRIKPKTISDEKLVFSFLNSLTALTAELEGRHYGGGVLELVPSEIERLLVPIVRMEKGDLEKLDDSMRSDESAEELLARQDKKILRDIGLTSSEIDIIFSAWNRLRLRRQRATEEKASKLISGTNRFQQEIVVDC
ncbi:N-6 DNA methylase [candidate division KSB1 bacterium]|nr:N-6 DNA methylase [candidate division KSB1 bacterium]